MKGYFLLALLPVCILCCVSAELVSNEVRVKDSSGRDTSGKVRYHHDAATACATVVMIGVGTAMTVGDYEALSADISTDSSIVTLITDHNSGFFVKLQWRQYRSFYNNVVSSISDIVPACKGKNPKIIVGGHSASGQAVIDAMAEDKKAREDNKNIENRTLIRKPDGFIGLDPFRINTNVEIDAELPVLVWGFSATTCSVSVDQAAKAAYTKSSKDHRVFYKIMNSAKNIKHCAFTDAGCGIACGKDKGGEWVHRTVAKSIQVFSNAVKTGSFPNSQFQAALERPLEEVQMFFNGYHF